MDTKDLPTKIRNLIEAVHDAGELTPARAGRTLEAAELSPDDLEPWADWNHPVADSYGRQMVFDGGYFELMVMSWLPGDMAAIHDHGYTQWGALRLFGDAEHAIFRTKNDTFTTTDRRIFAAGSVVNVNHDLIHQMGNTSSTPFLSLHLYGCTGRQGDITSEARVYELDQRLIQRVDGGVFFGLPDDGVLRTEPCPTPDFTTRCRHQTELLRRLSKMSGSLSDPIAITQRERALIERLFGDEARENAVEALAPLLEQSAAITTRLEAPISDLISVLTLRDELLNAGLLEGEPADSEALESGEPTRVAGAYLDLLHLTTNA